MVLDQDQFPLGPVAEPAAGPVAFVEPVYCLLEEGEVRGEVGEHDFLCGVEKSFVGDAQDFAGVEEGIFIVAVLIADAFISFFQAIVVGVEAIGLGHPFGNSPKGDLEPFRFFAHLVGFYSGIDFLFHLFQEAPPALFRFQVALGGEFQGHPYQVFILFGGIFQVFEPGD